MRIDLDEPPALRWRALSARRREVRALLDGYRADLGALAEVAEAIETAASSLLSDELLVELDGIANVLDAPRSDVLLCNLYYDLLKVGLGCSAFAIDRADGPLHARNLDWWSFGGRLRDESIVCEFMRGGRTHFKTVGWPAFAGCFSGVAPGRFAVTLNAVISDDRPELTEPITFLLRRVLDSAPDFRSALTLLRDTPIASDCLLLLTGARQGELAVIERTPRRASVRRAEHGFIEVTNDYRALGASSLGGELGGTSCGRAARMGELLARGVGDPWEVLADERVRMGITVQHMVLQAATGRCELRLPRE